MFRFFENPSVASRNNASEGGIRIIKSSIKGAVALEAKKVLNTLWQYILSQILPGKTNIHVGTLCWHRLKCQ